MDNLNVTEAFREHHRVVRENLAKAFGYFADDSVVEKAESEEELDINKGEEIENPFERQAVQDALEKSDIMEAISYDSKIKFNKKGEEIKEQIKSVILPTKQAELATKKSEADELLSECGDAPTGCCGGYYYGMDIDCGYKRYSWEETCMKCGDAEICDSLSYEHQESSPKVNRPKTKDEQEARNKYNRCVDIIFAIMADIKACEILSKNLKDDEEYELSPRQIIAFKMD